MTAKELQKKQMLTVDLGDMEPIIREMSDVERPQYYFGEAVGLLLFQPWYHCIAQVGHQANALTYEFPVRLKFIHDFIDPDGFINDNDNDWHGWNQPNWVRAVQELQEEGVRAIVCGCGLTGNMQSVLAQAVDIPVYTSTMMFVPEIHRTQAKGSRVGILTVSEEQLLAYDQILLRECGIDESIPIAIAGMNESAGADVWLTMTTPHYDFEKVQKAVVDAALELQSNHQDLGAFVLECTDMPMYSNAIREATGLAVFDAVDMVKRVNEQFTYATDSDA
jgi:Asp/Glu/hydantoin racemase